MRVMVSEKEGASTMTTTRPDFGSPYNNFYGSKYEELPTVKEVAASVRKQLNEATKDADSPMFGAKVSVRYRTYSGGCSIDTKIASPAHVIHNFDSYDLDVAVCTICEEPAWKARVNSGYTRYWMTEQGRAIHELAKGLLNDHNHDRSDIQTDYFDVRFYGEVEVMDMKEAV